MKEYNNTPDSTKDKDRAWRSSGLMHSLADAVTCALAVIGPDYRLMDVCRRMHRWFGDTGNGDRQTCYCFLHHRTDPCPGCPGFSSPETGARCADIETVDFAGGRRVMVTCAPLFGTDGAVSEMLAVAREIDADREHRYRLREAQYRHIIDNASDAILTFNEQGHIEQINRAACEMAGYTVDELIGKPTSVLIPPEQRDHQSVALQNLKNQQHIPASTIIEGRLLRRDGSIYPVEETISIQRNGSSMLITSIIRNISTHKNFEKDLLHEAAELARQVADSTRILRSTEQRYRALVNTANDAILSTNSSGAIVSCNKRAAVLFNRESDELIGRHITELMPDDVWHQGQSALQAPGASENRVLESQACAANGCPVPVEITISTFESDAQQQAAFIVHDISHHKNLEHKLQEHTATLEEKVRERTAELNASEQNLREKIQELSILKEISEALASAMELDAVLNIILAGATSHHGLGFNRAFLFLLSPDGRHLEGRVAIGPSDSSEAQKIWRDLNGKNLNLGEILQTYINRTGHIDSHVNQIIRSMYVPLSQEDHVLIQCLHSRQPCNIRNGHSDSRVPPGLLNAMNTDAFCLTPLMVKENVLGVLWADNAITGKPIEDRDIEQLHAFAVSASLAIEKSNLYHSIHDKFEELDAANRELQDSRNRLVRSEKLAAVGQMSATVAHGIRNPLVSIGGFARRMLKKEPEGSNTKKYLQIMVHEIDRMETILSELLDFVRPRKLTVRMLSINALIDTVLEIFIPEFESKQIKPDKQLDTSLPDIEIDADQFKRVLSHLFKNALDAMPDGGTLRVTTARRQDMLYIGIADSGDGIAPEDSEKIFHPFFTSKESGSGLGLAVCNQIISIHGGHITLRRQLPRGTALDIYLPLAAHGQRPADS